MGVTGIQLILKTAPSDLRNTFLVQLINNLGNYQQIN